MNNNNIPKVIHYCWFGGKPLPPLAIKCIESWRKYFPDYEIKRWDESNFDINIIPYTAQAYQNKKYAFVSDYARFFILYKLGGIYFDTDVEVIKPMDDIIDSGPFMGCERESNSEESPNALGVAPGLGLGVTPGLSLYKEFLDLYASLSFYKKNGELNTKTVVGYITELLSTKGLKNTSEIQKVAGITIYPKDFFCPIDYDTGKMKITSNTYSIHHYAASWHGNKEILYKTFERVFGKTVSQKLSQIWKAVQR